MAAVDARHIPSMNAGLRSTKMSGSLKGVHGRMVVLFNRIQVSLHRMHTSWNCLKLSPSFLHRTPSLFVPVIAHHHALNDASV